ncbi:MAG TPA: GNAT family N-acetyltransferase [Gaiellaceae bacterium]|nr:GNAT family N-acetyltransferase [Gaiellaceae bacterium]HUJ54939.1 GNAT family N-acetyltransferase [Gaiellaceae bacterium]
MAATELEPIDVILRDGSTLRLRAPVTEDADALLDFFSRLSEHSRYLRFHGFPTAGPSLVEPVLDPDWGERGALIGCLDDRIVALANWVRLRDPRAAEVAFTVDDDYQRRGIGTRLLEQLALRASGAGIEEFVAEVLRENDVMLAVFRDAGFDVTRAADGGELEIRFPLAPTDHYRDQVATRDHLAVQASLEPLFRPSALAVVGASSRRGSIGGELFRNVIDGDFAGSAYPVNRGGDPVAGVHGFRGVGEIPEKVELAVICVPGGGVLEAAEEALTAGVRALIVISAGFAETGAEGAERQERLLALARAHGARLVGPNCLGVSSSAVSLNATFAPRAFPDGKIGFSSQSGALGLAVLERASARGLGLTSFVSIGNKADVSSNDLLEWWEDDEATEIVMLYLESFGNPRAFARIARRLARRKPILAMKGGTTRAGSRAASSHTAALAGSEAAIDALFRQAGVIRTATLDELVDVAALLYAQPVPRGRRVAVLTNAGGLGILAADACESLGLELPAPSEETRAALASLLPEEASSANPIDMLGGANAQSFATVLPLVLADPGVDAVIVLFVPTVGVDEDEVGAAISEAAATANGKPVLCAFLSARGAPATLRSAAPVPAFDYPEAAARALSRAVERGEWLRRPAGTVPELDVDRAAAREVVNGADGWLDAAATRTLLAAYGIPVVPERVVDSVDEALAAARELGFPVVLKTALAGAHKTESGGVALNLADEAEVRAAAERIGAPLLVQPMILGGAELLAGAVQDPVFGPLVAFGPGGVLAELIGQAQFRLAPLTDLDARELVRGGKAGRLVGGFRGAAPADEAALVDLVLRLSLLADEVPEVAELDLNPVLALPDRCVAVDARIRVAAPAHLRRAKAW